jgi:hypothetical protein
MCTLSNKLGYLVNVYILDRLGKGNADKSLVTKHLRRVAPS